MQILDSFIEAGQELSAKDKQAYYAAVIEYLYWGREPKLKGPANAVFVAIRPSLDNSRARAEAGRNGGKQKRKQMRSKTEANAKQTPDFSESEEEEEKDYDPKGSKTPIPPYAEVVEHLNAASGKSYRCDSAATRDLIRARFDEGWALEDFKRVIDVKCASWLGDPKMEPYLRPQTLFARCHFEAYLNERPQERKEDGLGKYED